MLKDIPYTTRNEKTLNNDDVVKTANPTSSRVMLGEQELIISAYNIDESNYFKLRDIGKALDFSIEWDDINNRILIDTSIVYLNE